jgi:hypothetical protein
MKKGVLLLQWIKSVREVQQKVRPFAARMELQTEGS